MSLTKPISPKNREIINSDSYYKVCARKGDDCGGRITIEHALTYAGKRIDDLFNLIPLCWYHHLGVGLNKRWNIDYAMSRASEEDKRKYPRLPWKKKS